MEDSSPVLRLAEIILKRQGYKVIPAQNGQDALAALKMHRGPVHLLLTDVVMQGMNGRELYEKVMMGHPGLKQEFRG